MMTGSANSDSTTTSHTLTAEPPAPPMTDSHPASMQALAGTLSGSPYTFLQPPKSLHTAALVLTKRYLDPLAASVSEAHAQRLQDARKKRKRGEFEDVPSRPLQLHQLYLEGFEMPQVWEQARRVLDATRGEVEKALAELPQTNGEADRPRDLKMLKFDKDGFELDESDGESSLGEEGVDWEYDGEDHSEGSELPEDEDEDEDGSGLEDEEDEEGLEGLEGEDIEESGSGEEDSDDEPAEEFVEDKFGLNDGFFSIDDFNRQSEFLERQDNVGADDDAASDEEEIDWDADPMSTQPTHFGGAKGTSKSKSRSARDDEDEDMDDAGADESEDDEEGGPTFGNADLNAPEGASEDEDMDEDLDEQDHGGDNTNDIMYEDFFAPPARKASSNKKKQTRLNAKRAAQDAAAQPTPRHDDDGDEDHHSSEDERHMQRTMDAVRRDLFEDEFSGASDDEANASDASDASRLDPGDPRSRRSTHERRQAKIAEEIRRLEAANVAKREWTLGGEARAVDRPMNSLLEEDLEFERAGKPVPVITADITEDIESMIKRRILAQQFDDIPRRRPDDLAMPTSAQRRGRFELEDTKPQQSLAEMYEQDHLRRTDPNYVDQRDEKLKRQHDEIEALWRDVSAKLDGLCSYHYRPKPVAPTLNVVADVAAVSMEDARPTAGNEVAGASMLAPQEIFAPGKDSAGAGEVVTRAAAPVAKEEMTREEKLRRRRREKERIKKSNAYQGGGEQNGQGATGAGAGAGAGPGQNKRKTKAAEEQNVLSQLKKGGVKVIGKKGELRDVEGKKVAMAADKVSTGGGFKL